MPTNRTRVRRPRQDHTTPDWAAKLRDEGERPPRGAAAWHEFAGWWYFGDVVIGLPPSTSPEGMALVSRAREPERAD